MRKIPTPDELNIKEAAQWVTSRTKNPVATADMERIIEANVQTLRARAAKYPEDDWALVMTASAFEVTNLTYEFAPDKMLCLIEHTPHP